MWECLRPLSVDGLKDESMELQKTYDSILLERELLEAELQHHGTELIHLVDKKSR